jgi:hypothetical protein
MTEQERLSRAALLTRAVAAAGAVYAAPDLASSAGAEVDACAGQRCASGKKGIRKCRKRGGRGCGCYLGTCGRRDDHCPHDRCIHVGPCTQVWEPCQTGNCSCVCNGKGQPDPAVCIDLLDGLCDSFQDIGTCPSREDSECPAGSACFFSMCLDFGYPPLCGPCCPGTGAPPPTSTRSGPRIDGTWR